MSVVVKICGITNVADGVAAVDAGADVLGFVFYEASPRFLKIESAAEIIRQLPPFTVKTGVFVDAPSDLVVHAIGQCGLNLLQFHGSESPQYCAQFGLMSMKAFRIRDEASLDLLKQYPTEAWLLDSYAPGRVGGTGETFNWDLARRAQGFGKPIFLAGGLTAVNVGEAIEHVRPYGVDVSSGVEAAPGKKDREKLRSFIAAAKKAGRFEQHGG
jgi:phosphoribosylanthranilate isomerase